MSKLNYNKIQAIQENTTKKLINYINEFIQNDKILDTIEFYYPDFDEHKTKLAFNVWISIDYKTNYGKSFIEHMLEEKSSHLTKLEKEILIERNKSHISLYEIEKIEDNTIYLSDLLTGLKHSIWEPNLSSILKPTDIIFGRIGKIINFQGFIGNISFLPPSVKDLFIGEIFVDYNRKRFKFPNLTIGEYLKKYSINVYKIYTESVYEVVDMENDLGYSLYDEIDDYELYLQNYMSKLEIKRHISNLINLIEYYLMDEELSFYELEELDIEHLFKKAIKDKLITNQKEFSSYIDSFKKYFNFLKNRNPAYKNAYKTMTKLSKNRFLYIDNSTGNKYHFHIDSHIVRNIHEKLSEEAYDFIMDYEKFLLYIISKPLEVTEKRKYIKRKHLLELKDIIGLKKGKNTKYVNQDDFPIFHLFYQFSLHYKLLKLDKYYISARKASSNFLRLSDEEKFTLILQYILSPDFILSRNKYLTREEIDGNLQKILTSLAGLDEDTWFDSFAIMADNQQLKLFQNIYTYLVMLGLLKMSYYPGLSINITGLGKLVFKVLSRLDLQDEGPAKIIYLNKF